MSKVTRAKSPTGRLSVEQYDLMVYLFVRGAAFDPVEWSPTAFLESRDIAITKPRMSVVSRRLTSLIERSLLWRTDEGVTFVQLGITVLFDYAREGKHAGLLEALDFARVYWLNRHYSREMSRMMETIEEMESEPDLRKGPDGIKTRDLMQLMDRAAVLGELLDERAKKARAAYERMALQQRGSRS